MKKTFQKTLIAAAAGVALMSAAGTASANSLLFPYFKVGAGVQSVISLSNTGTVPATEAIHYSYGTGSTCQHYDTWGSLTPNDILTHSIAATAAGGFGKAVGTDTSTAGYFPTVTAEGFLIVSSTSSNSADALRGSMAVIDTATNGLVVTYAGIDNGLPTNATTSGKYVTPANGNANEGNFSALPADVNFPLTWLPTNLAATSWWTMVYGDMSNFARGVTGTWGEVVTFTNGDNAVWNNDEVTNSGTTTKAITCAGSLVATDLMTGNQKDALAIAGGGGLIKARGTLGSATAKGVVMMKVQALTSAAAPYNKATLLHREQAGL